MPILTCGCVFCCHAVHNPCAEQNGGCMHECRVDGSRVHCECKVGYILAEDGKTCQGRYSSDDVTWMWLSGHQVLGWKETAGKLGFQSLNHVTCSTFSLVSDYYCFFGVFKDFSLPQKLSLKAKNSSFQVLLVTNTRKASEKLHRPAKSQVSIYLI